MQIQALFTKAVFFLHLSNIASFFRCLPECRAIFSNNKENFAVLHFCNILFIIFLIKIYFVDAWGMQIQLYISKPLISLEQGAQLKSHGGPKKFHHTQGQKYYVFTHSKGAFIKERSLKDKILGQIKSFCGPHLARGPYVVHACSRVCLYQFVYLNIIRDMKTLKLRLQLLKYYMSLNLQLE